MTRNLPWLVELMPQMFVEMSEELAAELGIRTARRVTVESKRGSIQAVAIVTKRFKPFTVNGKTVHQIGLPWHWGFQRLCTGDSANKLTPPRRRCQHHDPGIQGIPVNVRKRSRRRRCDMTKAMLIDSDRCIGCRACQVACKQWNDLPARRRPTARAATTTRRRSSANTWTMVTFNEVEQNGELHWVFTKRQCMHCEHPACVSACTVGALRKTPMGRSSTTPTSASAAATAYACPFGVPSLRVGQAPAADPQVQLLRRSPGRGYGAGLRQGLSHRGHHLRRAATRCWPRRRRISADPSATSTTSTASRGGRHAICSTCPLCPSLLWAFAESGQSSQCRLIPSRSWERRRLSLWEWLPEPSALYWIIRRRQLMMSLQQPLPLSPEERVREEDQ